MTLFIKNLLFTLLVPGTVGVYAPLLLAQGRSPRSGVVAVAASLCFAGASLVYLWALADFATRGRGTPLPIDAPKRLIVSGPYRYTRNPMYVALFLALLGWILIFQTVNLVLYALAVGALIVRFVTRYEEPHLREVFGADYDRYRKAVPRWFPRRPRAPDA